MRALASCSLAALLTAATPLYAGVVNPDISVVGQPVIGLTDDAASTDAKRVRFDVGETEFVFDSYLNPYARGLFILSLADQQLDLEEGYFTILRGLPFGLNLKGGKYRVGFGKLNTAHPHANPFAEPFHVLRAYLPGDEAFNETGLSLSERIPVPGDVSLTASFDWLQGDTFRRERDVSQADINAGDPRESYTSGPDRAGETRPAFVGRISGFTMVGERSGLEFGISATQGTNNVAAGARTRIFGTDLKAKLWTSAQSYLVLQGELLKLDREDASWDSESNTYVTNKVSPVGGYVFADYNFAIRYNAGASLESYQSDDADKVWNKAIGLFTGFALMEETTAIRLDWNHFIPGTPDGAEVSLDPINTVTLRVIYSMGPHKAHQF